MKISLLLILIIPSIVHCQSLIKLPGEQSTLTRIFDGGYFTEGPVYAADGNLYFSDLTFTEETNMQAGIIWKHDPVSGKTTVYRSPSGMANGMEVDNQGNLIVCEGADFGGRKITCTDLSTGKSKILTALYKGHPYNSPNDLIIDKKNRIYFTDPRYSGHEEIDQPCFGVYRLDPDGKVSLLIDNIPMPNGIALSPDEDKLYIGCNYEGNDKDGLKPVSDVFVYDIDRYGAVSNGKVFIDYPDESAPDGLTVDKEGNLYAALRNESAPGIYIYNPAGSLIERIDVPEVPGNLTFGKGKDKNSLFITAGGCVYKIQLRSEGIQ